ncbi:MAG TPA: hypothetical protein VLC53_18305 [Myxococcota bacterium]|nr:hypothetical protein [Myxococcota bacterium]
MALFLALFVALLLAFDAVAYIGLSPPPSSTTCGRSCGQDYGQDHGQPRPTMANHGRYSAAEIRGRNEPAGESRPGARAFISLARGRSQEKTPF